MATLLFFERMSNKSMAYTALGVVNLLVSTQNVRYILGRSRVHAGHDYI